MSLDRMRAAKQRGFKPPSGPRPRQPVRGPGGSKPPVKIPPRPPSRTPRRK